MQFFYRDSGGTGTTENVTGILTGEWYHYAAVYNGSDYLLYVNGTLEKTITDTISQASSHMARMGANPEANDEYFHGAIDDVLILNRSLSADEISSLYNATESQYESSFTTLSEGAHELRGHAASTNGKKNQTDQRKVTIDTSPPNVTLVTASPGTTFDLSDTIEINATVDDHFSGVDSVIANITLPNSTVQQVSLDNFSANVYNTSFIVPSLIGTYTVRIIANDTLGSINSSETTTFEVENDVPDPSGVQVIGGDISLTEGANKTVTGTATITDLNGYGHISNVTGYLFLTSEGQGEDNASRHYTSACASNVDGSGTSESYNCTFNVTHYAIPTDSGSQLESTNWTFLVSPLDVKSTGTNGTDIVEMNTLLAFDISPSVINFGSLNLSTNTTDTNEEINVTNLGNVQVDIMMSGTNLSCNPGIIPVNFLEYEDNPFTYGVGIDLLESGVELDLDVSAGYQGDEMPTKTTYYGFGVPSSSVGGACTGTVVLAGQADPLND